MNSTSTTRGRSTAKKLALFALLLFFSAGLCVGAWWMQHYVSSSLTVRQLLRSEPFHVCAHLGLYGTLYAICRALIGRWGVAAALTLCVAFAQETVQVVTYRRTFGGGELFDLLVDCVAIALVERWWRRRSAVNAP